MGREKERRNAYRILDGKPEGKTPLGRPIRRREDTMELHFQTHILGDGGRGMD